MDCFSEGIMLVNTDSENWNILFVNDAWSRVTGESRLARKRFALSFHHHYVVLLCIP